MLNLVCVSVRLLIQVRHYPVHTSKTPVLTPIGGSARNRAVRAESGRGQTPSHKQHGYSMDGSADAQWGAVRGCDIALCCSEGGIRLRGVVLTQALSTLNISCLPSPNIQTKGWADGDCSFFGHQQPTRGIFQHFSAGVPGRPAPGD